MRVVNELFELIADFPDWIEAVDAIQREVFNAKPDYSVLLLDRTMYSGRLILKFIYAGENFQDRDQKDAIDRDWPELIAKEIPGQEFRQYPKFIQQLLFSPRHLTADEMINPRCVLKRFYKRRKAVQWAKRWNQFREYALCTYSVCEGDEGEYLEDFQSFLKLVEAVYLIHLAQKLENGRTV